MLIELHILQNFAPSNLNRDDTGSPKDCEFGGYRRARISSQCLKRAVRTAFKDEELLPTSALGIRTKRIAGEVARRMGKREDDAAPVVRAMLQGVKIGFDTEGKSQYLLYLGESELDRLAALCQEHWEQLSAIVPSTGATEPAAGPRPRASARDSKRAGSQDVPQAVRTALQSILEGSKAADVALFGRMLADLPERNIDAACQVAHALSTHKVGTEFDFYTAVDDIRPEDTAGADMLGVVEFNSACFYRYANVDLRQLDVNLQRDGELARQTLLAFLRASVTAIPTGKQNSMAAQNPPSFVLVVARQAGLWSLANAFLKPVRPSEHADLVEGSARALASYWGKLRTMYGSKGFVDAWAVSLHDGIQLEGVTTLSTIDDLVERAGQTISAAQAMGVPA